MVPELGSGSPFKLVPFIIPQLLLRTSSPSDKSRCGLIDFPSTCLSTISPISPVFFQCS